MKDVMFNTSGVCARQIFFQLDDEGKMHNLQFNGGCNGNLKAIGKLCEGQDAKSIASIDVVTSSSLLAHDGEVTY